MAYRYGDRKQIEMFPPCLEDYVPKGASVRAYDALIEVMDLAAMGFRFDPSQVGNSSYDPQAMLKLLVYGYSYGVCSSRKLERECHYNLSFLWLMGGLKPDHKTIAEFRRRNKSALQKVIQQCARSCIKIGLIAGNVLFVDGTKMRANASVKHSWTKERAQKALAQLDRHIQELLTECETVDQQEQQDGSWVRLNEEWADAQALKAKVKAVLADLQAEEKPSVNTTDPDCVRVHSRQGSHAGYNSQIVVDDENGLIVNSDVVSASNDSGQFGTQITQANEVLEEPCKAGCGDAGFADYEDLAALADEMDVIVPSRRQAHKNPTEPGPFDKSCFTYDQNTDTYLCPNGHTLGHRGYEKRGKRHYYTGGSTCLSCEHFGSCTTDRVNGRKVTRSDYEAVREKLEIRYEQPDAQAIFRRRKEKVEHPFGHIKRNLHRGYFLLRGLAGVRAEMSLLACAFNVTRMITLVGVTELIAQLAC